MAEYQSFIAPEFVFGPGIRHLAGKYARKLSAERVLLVSDPGVCAQHWVDDVRKSLAEAKIEYIDFNAVTTNPTIEQVAAGLFIYRKSNCDVIIAIGGGSPIDCAKAIGLLASNEGNLSDFAGTDRVPRPLPPLLCLPTAASSSAEVSPCAIIGEPDKRVKYVISSKALIPDIALIDPQTLGSYPANLIAEKGLAALSNAIESFTCTCASILTDLHAREAIPLIARNLTAFVENQNQGAAQAGLLRGSLEAGLAFSNAGLGAVQAMSNALEAWFDLPYGPVSARLLPLLIEHNFKAQEERFTETFRLLGMHQTEPKPLAWAKGFFKTYYKNLGLSPKLALDCPTPAELAQLAGRVLADPCFSHNPNSLSESEIIEIYRKILH